MALAEGFCYAVMLQAVRIGQRQTSFAGTFFATNRDKRPDPVIGRELHLPREVDKLSLEVLGCDYASQRCLESNFGVKLWHVQHKHYATAMILRDILTNCCVDRRTEARCHFDWRPDAELFGICLLDKGVKLKQDL